MDKFDKAVLENGKSKFKTYKHTNMKGQSYNVDVGYEMFMGPEMFFKPVS